MYVAQEPASMDTIIEDSLHCFNLVTHVAVVLVSPDSQGVYMYMDSLFSPTTYRYLPQWERKLNIASTWLSHNIIGRWKNSTSSKSAGAGKKERSGSTEDCYAKVPNECEYLWKSETCLPRTDFGQSVAKRALLSRMCRTRLSLSNFVREHL